MRKHKRKITASKKSIPLLVEPNISSSSQSSGYESGISVHSPGTQTLLLKLSTLKKGHLNYDYTKNLNSEWDQLFLRPWISGRKDGLVITAVMRFRRYCRPLPGQPGQVGSQPSQCLWVLPGLFRHIAENWSFDSKFHYTALWTSVLLGFWCFIATFWFLLLFDELHFSVSLTPHFSFPFLSIVSFVFPALESPNHQHMAPAPSSKWTYLWDILIQCLPGVFVSENLRREGAGVVCSCAVCRQQTHQCKGWSQQGVDADSRGLEASHSYSSHCLATSKWYLWCFTFILHVSSYWYVGILLHFI